jgi:hypothetical protein
MLPPDVVDSKHEDAKLKQSKDKNKLSEYEEMYSVRCSFSDAELDRILSPDNENLEKGNHIPALACGEVH